MEKKAKEDQEPRRHCCRTAPMWESDVFTAKDKAAPGTGCVRTGIAARRSLAAEKEEFNRGDYWRDFLGPLRALVRGARTKAVLRRNPR